MHDRMVYFSYQIRQWGKQSKGNSSNSILFYFFLLLTWQSLDSPGVKGYVWISGWIFKIQFLLSFQRQCAPLSRCYVFQCSYVFSGARSSRAGKPGFSDRTRVKGIMSSTYIHPNETTFTRICDEFNLGSRFNSLKMIYSLTLIREFLVYEWEPSRGSCY